MMTAGGIMGKVNLRHLLKAKSGFVYLLMTILDFLPWVVLLRFVDITVSWQYKIKAATVTGCMFQNSWQTGSLPDLMILSACTLGTKNVRKRKTITKTALDNLKLQLLQLKIHIS